MGRPKGWDTVVEKPLRPEHKEAPPVKKPVFIPKGKK